jgi:Tol biopolymer transport system component
LYEASDNGSTDLYLTRADASGRMLLGPHSRSERAPHPSPNLKFVAFLSNRINPGEYEIYLMDADGSGARMLTEIGGSSRGSGWTGDMAWSPDSTQLVAVFDRANPEVTFHIERGDPVDQSRHYDGQWEGQLYKIDLRSGALEALTPPDMLTWNPIWSPDGSRVYFNALRDGYSRIFSIKADGSDLQVVGQPDGLIEQSGFTFSADGKSLAYLALRRTRGSLRPDEVRLLDLVSGEVRSVWTIANTAAIDLPLAARFSMLRWSPDGQRLAYAIPQPDGKAVLKMLDLAQDPTAPTGIAVESETVLFVGIDLYFPGHYPVWSLDSRSMAILLQRQVYVISTHSNLDSGGGADLVEIYAGKRDEIGAGWLSWLP